MQSPVAPQSPRASLRRESLGDRARERGATGGLRRAGRSTGADEFCSTRSSDGAGIGSTRRSDGDGIGSARSGDGHPKEQPPVQGREDVRQPEQRKDFEHKGDGAGPKPGN